MALRNAKLTLDDIVDLRAYERERPAFRERIIDIKARRRVHVGTIISLVFENRETMRFQIQEMARAEKLTTDDQIQIELDVYNPLIPEPGVLSATLFIECTSNEQMREWFPKLVGIERSVELVVGEGSSEVRVRCAPDVAHSSRLTRDDITAAVHYVRFPAGVALAEAVRHGPAKLEVVHPAYRESTDLSAAARHELAGDIEG